MKITILTLFPEMFDGPFRESILKHAQQKNLLEIKLVNIRDFGEGKHKVVDDRPYGGGVGMVMRVDILDKAIESVKNKNLSKSEQKVILLDARGEKFKQQIAKDFSKLQHLILLCGHYEGVDERVRSLVDQTISIGDFITTGGEIPAMLLVDSVARLIPGVLKEDATKHESFSILNESVIPAKAGIQKNAPGSRIKSGMTNSHLLEYPQYTGPREYNGETVPEILLSGNHSEIEKWRNEQAKEITQQHRPDLLEK